MSKFPPADELRIGPSERNKELDVEFRNVTFGIWPVEVVASFEGDEELTQERAEEFIEMVRERQKNGD